MPIIISVDLGTTKITSLAMDAVSGEVLAVATEVSEANVTRIEDRPRGRSEWNARRIVEHGLGCMKSVVQKLGPRASEVAGIGITGQQHGVVLIDARGEPASPLINWQDRRALDLVQNCSMTWLDAARAAVGEDSWQTTGCRLQPGFMAVTLFWLKAHQLLPANARACFIMDYFGSVLTDQPPITEPSCAGSSGVLDVRTRQWSEAAIMALELPRSLFPEIREADQQIGQLTHAAASATGLPAGTPVFAPIGDHQASFLGSVTDRRASVLVNVGTGAQVAVFTESGVGFQPPIELRPFPCRGNLMSNVGLAGGWSYQVLEQFFRNVGDKLIDEARTVPTTPLEPSDLHSPRPGLAGRGAGGEGASVRLSAPVRNDNGSPPPLYELMNRLAANVAAGADGLRCEPHFSGTRLDPTVRGSLTGLTPGNFTPEHLARAVLEGMARSLHDGFTAIHNITGHKPTQLISAGNGLRENRLLAEIVSQSFGLPLTFTPHREEAAYGAARIAAAGCGVPPTGDE